MDNTHAAPTQVWRPVRRTLGNAVTVPIPEPDQVYLVELRLSIASKRSVLTEVELHLQYRGMGQRNALNCDFIRPSPFWGFPYIGTVGFISALLLPT
jgi:hypothetical protein